MAQSDLQDLPKTIAKDVTGFIPAPVRNLWSKYSGAVDDAKAATKKVDTSWHNKEVEEANESFRKPVGKKAAPAAQQTVKKAPAKKTARKKAY